MCHPCHAFAFRTRGHADTRTRGHADTVTQWHSKKIWKKITVHAEEITVHVSGQADTRTRGHTRGHADTVTHLMYTVKIFGTRKTRTRGHACQKSDFLKKYFLKKFLTVHAEEIVVDTTLLGWRVWTHLGAEECVGHIGFQLYDLKSLYDFIQCNYMYMYTLLHCYLKESNWIQYCWNRHLRLNSINKWHNAIPVIWLDNVIWLHSMQLFMYMYILLLHCYLKESNWIQYCWK